MCKPRTTFYLVWWPGPTVLWLYGSELACLPGCPEMVKAGWLGSIWSGIFFNWNLTFSKLSNETGCPTYLASLLHINNFLFSHFCLLQNATLHKMLKLGFWNFKTIFLRIWFLLDLIFFLVLVICLSWSLHPKLFYEVLTHYII